MFFHIDESGNTGNNLSDTRQPVLSYGVLSSKTNSDVLATRQHALMLQKIAKDSIHATDLGADGLRPIAEDLVALQKQFDFRFDYYFVEKKTFAVVMLFNAVFDAGVNEAVPADWYWTPLRFPLVQTLARLVDEDLLKEAWALTLIPHAELPKVEDRIAQLLNSLLERLAATPVDARLGELARDALHFGTRYPAKLDFGSFDQKLMSPNAVGFQFVLAAITNRQKTARRKALGITVDQQMEFNEAQLQTYSHRSNLSAALKASPADRKYYLWHPWHEGAREEVEQLIWHFPKKELRFCERTASIGLQIADVYLWVANRVIKKAYWPPELKPLAHRVFTKGRVNGISIDSMMGRWEEFRKKLYGKFPQVSGELQQETQSRIAAHRAKVRNLKLTE